MATLKVTVEFPNPKKKRWRAWNTGFPSSQAGNRFPWIQVWNHSTICLSGDPAPSSTDVFTPSSQQKQSSVSSRNPLVWMGFLIGRFLSRLDSYLLSMWSCCCFKRLFFCFEKKMHPCVLVRTCFDFYESSTKTVFCRLCIIFLAVEAFEGILGWLQLEIDMYVLTLFGIQWL